MPKTTKDKNQRYCIAGKRGGLILGVKGQVERTEVIHVIVQERYDLTGLLSGLTEKTGSDLRLETPVSSNDKANCVFQIHQGKA